MNTNDLQPIKYFTRINQLAFFTLSQKVRPSTIAMLLVMSKGMFEQKFQTEKTLYATFRDILSLSKNAVQYSFEELERERIILQRTRHSVILNPGFMNKHEELPRHLQAVVVNAPHTLGDIETMRKIIELSDYSYRRGYSKSGEHTMLNAVEELGKLYQFERELTDYEKLRKENKQLKISQIEDAKTIASLREEILKLQIMMEFHESHTRYS